MRRESSVDPSARGIEGHTDNHVFILKMSQYMSRMCYKQNSSSLPEIIYKYFCETEFSDKI